MPALRQLFPGLDVLHQETTAITIGEVIDGVPTIKRIKRKGQFSFAMKRFYDSASFHGSADYLLENPSFYELKMRGYETRDKDYYAMTLTENGLEITNEYANTNPGKKLLEQIRDHDMSIFPDIVCLFSAILKPSELQKGRTKRYAHALVTIGDDIFRQRLVKEWSLSQFTYNTAKQYDDILREFTRCRNRFSWYVEPYFLNTSGHLLYRHMIETCDQLIRKNRTLEPHTRFHPDCDDPNCAHKEGKHSLLYALDPHDHYTRQKNTRYHPSHETYRAVQELLRNMLNGKNLDDTEEE